MKSVLTAKDKAFIRRNRLKMPGSHIAEKIGCDKGVVGRYLKQNGLTPSRETIIAFRVAAHIGQTSFTAAEDRYIRKNYLKYPVKTLGDKMGRSYTGIMGRLRALELEIPPGIRERNIQAGRLQKGNIPSNKGKKMSRKMYRVCKPTMFKPGHLPHNTKKDGAISVRVDKRGVPYKHIRTEPGKWVPYQRYRWELFRGPIPKRMIVTFKDGNTLNCKLSNLELITMAENAVRNKQHIPLDLARTVITLGKLNKKIKQYEKQN